MVVSWYVYPFPTFGDREEYVLRQEKQSFLGVFVPFFYLTSYARSVQGMPYTESLNLLLVLNGIGFVG